MKGDTEMNLQPLYELRERLESSMIAGVSLLSDDFRFARAVEQIKPLARASPVIQRVYHSVRTSLDPDCTDRCGAILDAYSLTNAILCTQGIVEVNCEIEEVPLAESGGCPLSNAPYSAVVPLLEALTTSGRGHYSTVVDIHKAHPELFQDYRLKDALIKGLGAGYSDLADQIEQWLCEEGNKVVPLLKQGLDPKGTKEMVRRLRVIESICREKENDYYISLLENAEKKVREKAIHALRHNKGNTQLLLNLVKTEKGGCKKAAQAALSCMEDPEALNYWKTSVKKKTGTAAAFLVLSESDGIADILAESLETLTERFLLNVRECRDTADADIKAFDILMKALLKKSSPTVINWYRQVCQKDAAGRLDKLTDSKKKQVKFSADCSGIVSNYQYKSPEPFAKMIPHVLTNAMLSSPKQPLLNLAEELFSTEGEDYFKPALIAGLLSRPSREVYEKFIPYIESSESILSIFYHQILSLIHFDPNSRRFELRLLVEDFVYPGEGSFVFRQPLFEPLGIEWFELIASGRLDKVQTEGPYSLSGLINPSDCRVCEVMGEYFYRQAWEPSVDVERLFCTLDKCGWIGDKCKGIIVAAVKKGFYTKSNRGLNAFWDFFSMVYNAPMTDAQKADEVEEVIELIHSSQAEICNWHDQKMIDWCQKIRDNEKG